MSHDSPAPRHIDLNADVGEGYDDAALIPFVTSANVACGGHAGDLGTMRATVRLARAHGVTVGAHPGFADRAGFGRRITTRDPAAIDALVREQLGSLAEVAASEGATLAHVKPHGALYNLSAVDDVVAAAVAAAVRDAAPGARLVGLAGSRSLVAARAAGLDALAEGFADRGYLRDGTLAARDRAGAVVTLAAEAARRAVRIATTGTIDTLDGAPLALQVDTLCLHGDTPGAAARARAIRAALQAAGVVLRAPQRRPDF